MFGAVTLGKPLFIYRVWSICSLQCTTQGFCVFFLESVMYLHCFCNRMWQDISLSWDSTLRLRLPPGFWVWIVQRVSGVVSQIKVADSPGGTPHTISIYRLCTLSGRVIGFYWSAFFFSTTCSFYAGIFFYSVTGLKYNRVQSQMYSKVKIDILYYRRYMCSNTITQVHLIPYFLTLKMESKIFK